MTVTEIDNLRSRLLATSARAGVRSTAEGVRGDHDFDPELRPKPPYVPAAVLVPIVMRDPAPTLLLTRRTAHLYAHAGQISFPGGREEPFDRSPLETALREAEEEVGLARGHVEILGQLDVHETGTGFRITPFVGLVRPGFTLAIDTFEVAEAFEVPLAFVLDPSNHQRQSGVFRGTRREFYVLPFEGRHIWGATARMLVNLYDRLHRAGS